MPKPSLKSLTKLAFADHPSAECEGEVRLETIIQTFRENNLKLLKKIEECDRQRESQQVTRRRKQSQPPLPEAAGGTPREVTAEKSKRRSLMREKVEGAVKENTRKENLAELKRKTIQRSE
jgi:hypothetical protein